MIKEKLFEVRTQAALEGIRNLHREFSGKDNAESLCRTFCRSLMHNPAFQMCWVGLLNSNGQVQQIIFEGAPEDKEYLQDMLEKPCIPESILKKLSSEQEFISELPHHNSPDCPISQYFTSHNLYFRPISEGNRLFGFVGVAVDPALEEQKEDLQFLKDLSSQLSHTLHLLKLIGEKEEALSDLQVNETLLQSVFHHSDNAIYMKDTQGGFLAANPYFCKLVGHPEEDIIGQTNKVFLPDKEASLFDQTDQVVLKTGRPLTDEITVPLPDGRKSLLFVKFPIRNPGGEIQAIGGIISDITEQKKSIATHQRLEREKSIILDSMSEIFVYYDSDLRIKWTNKACAENLRCDTDELLGRHCYQIWHKQDEPCQDCPVLKAAETGRPQSAIIRMPGNRYWAIRGYPVYDESHSLIGLLELGREITAEKRKENALQESETRYRTLVESMADPVFLLDEQTNRIVDSNHAAHQLYGFSQKEFLSKNWEYLADVYSPAKGAGLTTDVPLFHKNKNGQRFPVEITETQVLMGDRKRKICVVRDISDRIQVEEERNQLESQVRQTQKMEAIGQLAGGVAHDFNNLLQAIKGYTDMALFDVHSPESVKANLQEVQRASNRAADLVRQLLVFSRKESLKPEPLDLNLVIQNLMKMLRRVIGEHIELVFEPAEGLNNLFADAGQVEQILINLCVNARDAMLDGGEIHIHTSNIIINENLLHSHTPVRPGPYVLLTVSDNGVGIPEEYLDRIFEPFFTTKKVGEGTGLGLATVYAVVRRHHGFVDLKSTPGHGTTFHIYFPVVEINPNDQENIEEKSIFTGNQETILLAEDDDMVRTLAVKILQKAGYQVLAASDGEEALRLFERHRNIIDLALLDVVMPKKSGKAVYDVLSVRRPELPIIFSSGYSQEKLPTSTIERDNLTLIQKPYNPADLLHRIQEVFED